MSRQLTQYETNRLFHFCHQHFVYHYDVQIELVDHLASSIENQWEKDPELSFEKALYSSFKGFGITGFSKVKTEKEKALRKKYNRILWKYLLEFYRLPKIIMTFAFTIVLFTLLKTIDNTLWVLMPYFVALTIAIIYYYFKIIPKHYKIETKPGKSFMLLNQLKQVQLAAVFAVQIPIHSFNLWHSIGQEIIKSNTGLLLVSFLIITLTIMLYGQLMYVPKKIKEHFMVQFAEFAV